MLLLSRNAAESVVLKLPDGSECVVRLCAIQGRTACIGIEEVT